MSDHRLARIEYLRRRAKELRAVAARMTEDHHREILLACARDYDQLAEMQKRLMQDPPADDHHELSAKQNLKLAGDGLWQEDPAEAVLDLRDSC